MFYCERGVFMTSDEQRSQPEFHIVCDYYDHNIIASINAVLVLKSRNMHFL